MVPEVQPLPECQDHLGDQDHLLFRHLRVFQVLLLSPEALALQDCLGILVLLDSLLALQVHLAPWHQENLVALVCLAHPWPQEDLGFPGNDETGHNLSNYASDIV